VEFLDWLKMLFALIATLSLLGLAAYGARRFGLLQMGGAARAARRLKVSESLIIDARRRLVLVKCDAREHLILLSPTGDCVVAGFDAPPETIVEPAP
jgi:flagellar protein FliO/FliZ